MIQFRKDEDRDYRWLNRTIAPYVNQLIRDDQTLSLKQEAAIKQMLREIIAGYKHTISRLEWGD
jgi:hypothetical protein